MKEKEVVFHGNKLWFSKDHLTENSLVLSLFYCEDDWGLSTLKLKLEVSNYKKRIDNHVFLEHRDIYNYLKIAKDILSRLQSSLASDSNFSGSLSFVSSFKTKVRTAFLIKPEFENKYVAAIIFSDKETNLTDNEKVFVSLNDYYSFIDILEQFKNNYLIFVDSALNRLSMIDVLTKIDTINEKLTNYTSQIYGRLHLLENNEKQVLPQITTDSISVDVPKEQLEIDNFISENADKMNIGLEPQLEIIKDKETINFNPPPEVKILDEDYFTARVLEGGVRTLEEIALGCVSDPIPLLKVLKILATKLQIPEDKIVEKFFPGCDIKEFYALLYLNTRYVKYVLNEHLELKKPMQPSVLPMYINCNGCDKFNVSLMYDLLVYFTFYTHLKGQLQVRIKSTSKNKSIVCFIIKAIFSPLVFSYLTKGSTKEVIVSEVVNRYKKYKDNKVFDTIIKEIELSYGTDIDISEDSIRKTISGVCDIAINNISAFELKNVAEKFSVYKVPISSIFEVNNLETLTKILVIESLFLANNKVDKAILKDQKGINTLEEIPESILSLFDLGEKKVNKENLERFVTETMKDSSLVYSGEALDAVKLINMSFRDLKNKDINFVNFDDNILKAFAIWDIEDDEKIQDSYSYFKNKIENCTMDRNMALSILMNIEDKTASDYANSLKVSSAIN